MAETHQPAEAQDQVETQRGEREDHDAREERDVEGLLEYGGIGRHQGEEPEQREDGDEAPVEKHPDQPCRVGNRPRGFSTRTAAISR
jgi:hypothetical protein